MSPYTYGWYPASQPAPHVALLVSQVAPLETIYMVGGQGVLQLDRLPAADLRLRRPLAVHVAWSPETCAYAAYAERNDLWFGLGSSPQNAIADLAEVLVMVYHELASDPAVLAAPLRRQFADLQQLITPCPSK